MKTLFAKPMGRAAGVLLSALTLGCQGGTQIDVRVAGRPDDATNMVVTAQLNEEPAVGTGQSLAQAQDHFYVQLQATTAGQVKLHVSAQNTQGCEIAAGDGAVRVNGPGSYPLAIELTPQQGCSLQVELVGPAQGQVTSAPAGIDCGSKCTYGFGRNQVVGLIAATPELLGGWFTDTEAGACAGRVSCAITIGSGVTKVRANFIHQSSCASSSWCSEEGLPKSPSTLYAVWGSGRDDVWAVGDAGTMVHGDGILWSAVPAVTPRALRSIWGSARNDVWAVGDTGTILHFDGAAWTAMYAPTSAWLTGIWGSARNDVWAVGDTGTILHFDGTAWTPVASGTTQSLRAVWGSGSQDVWAVGDSGTIVRWGGALWTPIAAAGLATSLYAVWGTGATNIWMVGDGGTILRWRGSGAVGQTQVRGVSGLHAVWGTSPTQTWAVGDSGAVVLWDGSAWTPVPALPSSGLLAGIWGGGPLDVWAVGLGDSILRYRP